MTIIDVLRIFRLNIEINKTFILQIGFFSILGIAVMSYTYQALKDQFVKSEEAFRAELPMGQAERRAIVSTLANAEYDNDWPLAMLKEVEPRLSRGLSVWTAGGCESIRNAQELGAVTEGTAAFDLEQTFSELPLWIGQAIHVSKDSDWFDRVSQGVFELRSFMGCGTPESSFAYVANPKARLVFTELKSARLVGALTREAMEREVLLPKGAQFRVVSINRPGRTVILAEQERA